MRIHTHWILTLLIMGTQVVQTQSTCPHYKKKRAPQWSTFFKRYVPSLALSTLVGAATGSLNRYLDRKLPQHTPIPFIIWILISWHVEKEIRESIIYSLQQDMDSCYIPYKKETMGTFAWLAAWTAYFLS